MKSFKQYLTEFRGVEKFEKNLDEFADDSTSAIPGTPENLKEMSSDQVFFKVSGRAQKIMNRMKWDEKRLKSFETHGDTYSLNKADADELRAELIRQGAIDDFDTVTEDSLSRNDWAFKPGDTVYSGFKKGTVDRVEGEKIFVHLDDGDMDVFHRDQTSFSKPGLGQRAKQWLLGEDPRETPDLSGKNEDSVL